MLPLWITKLRALAAPRPRFDDTLETALWAAPSQVDFDDSGSARAWSGGQGSASADGRNLEQFNVLRTAVEREEHAANLIRLRKATFVSAILWPCFFGMDLLMAAYVPGASFVSYALIRAAVWLLLLAAGLTLTYAKRLSPRDTLYIDTFVCGGASTAVALMCLLHDDVVSPYAAGVPVIMTVRAAFLTSITA